MQRCRGAEVQRCRGAEVQRCRGAEVQRCRVASGCAGAPGEERLAEGEEVAPANLVLQVEHGGEGYHLPGHGLPVELLGPALRLQYEPPHVLAVGRQLGPDLLQALLRALVPGEQVQGCRGAGDAGVQEMKGRRGAGVPQWFRVQFCQFCWGQF